MSYRTVSEPEFRDRIREVLRGCCNYAAVTGPGRSGAVAAVYASHILGIPFVPYRQPVPEKFRGRMLVIDTARWTGATIRKAGRLYPGAQILTVYNEPPMVRFWYEARAQHETAEPREIGPPIGARRGESAASSFSPRETSPRC